MHPGTGAWDYLGGSGYSTVDARGMSTAASWSGVVTTLGLAVACGSSVTVDARPVNATGA
jgi:hypothetical protein